MIFSYLSLIWEIFGSGEVTFVYFWEWQAVWALLVAGREHRRVVNCKAIVLPKQSSAWHLSRKLSKHSCLFTHILMCGHDGRKQNTISDSNVSSKAMQLTGQWCRTYSIQMHSVSRKRMWLSCADRRNLVSSLWSGDL